MSLISPLKILIVACLVGFSVVSQAEDYNISINGKKFPIDILPEIRSTSSNMSMDDFAFVVGQKLREFTDQNGYEACAMICKGEGGAWAASPISMRSHVACFPTSLCPSGTTITNQSIHSHPTVKSYVPKEVDRAVLGDLPKSPGGPKKIKTPPSEEFSMLDYKGGAGYMVSETTLYYQNGRGTDRIVKRLNNSAADSAKAPSSSVGAGSR